MKTTRSSVLVLLALSVVAAAGARAAGPVDVEVGGAYWFSETEDSYGSTDAGDAGIWAAIGFGRWTFAGSRWSASPDGGDLEYTAFDVTVKLVKPTEGNYIALGIGGEQIGFSGGGLDDDVEAVRLIVEAGAGAKWVRAYARYVYFASVGDLETPLGVLQGDGGDEIEAGLGIQPLPFLHLRAGYKKNTFDFKGGATIETSGPFAGVNFRF